MNRIPELTAEQMARAIPARVRKRLMLGQIESGEDIAALRRFVDLTQAQFAEAMGISVYTLQNWEQGRRRPEGPAIGLLRIAARHPRIIREQSAAKKPAAKKPAAKKPAAKKPAAKKPAAKKPAAKKPAAKKPAAKKPASKHLSRAA